MEEKGGYDSENNSDAINKEDQMKENGGYDSENNNIDAVKSDDGSDCENCPEDEILTIMVVHGKSRSGEPSVKDKQFCRRRKTIISSMEDLSNLITTELQQKYPHRIYDCLIGYDSEDEVIGMVEPEVFFEFYGDFEAFMEIIRKIYPFVFTVKR